MRGRAIASPVTISELTFSVSISRQASAGSNPADSTTVFPVNVWPISPHWLAPCMSGAMK